MAYYSGQAASSSELLAVLKNACIAKGWSSNGNILSKEGCFVEITPATSALVITGGTGISNGQLTGGNTLTGGSDGLPKVNASLLGVGSAITFPVNYFIHIFDNPNEVFLIVKYGVDKYSYLSFGQLKNPLSGTGNWYGALGGNLRTSSQWLSALNLSNSNGGMGGGISGAGITSSGALFSLTASGGTTGNTYTGINSAVHHQLDGNEWSQGGTSSGTNGSSGFASSASLAQSWKIHETNNSRQPSNWNDEAVLLPIMPSVFRPSSKVSILGEIKNARYVNIKNLEPEQIITLGSDKWKIYPWFRKDATVTSASATSSAQFGWAIRYDGP